MKTKLLFLTTVILLAPLVGGALFVLLAQEPCPTQVFRDLATAPATLDAAQIAVDPNTGSLCCLGWIRATPGRPWTWTARFCDPDGDTLTLTASAGTLRTSADQYTVTGVAGGVGIEYVTMTLVDQPVADPRPVTRKGTFAVIVTPRNRPPSLCGGLP